MTPVVTSATVVGKDEQMVGAFAYYTITMLIETDTDNGSISFRTRNAAYADSLLVGQSYTITIT